MFVRKLFVWLFCDRGSSPRLSTVMAKIYAEWRYRSVTIELSGGLGRVKEG